MTRLAWTARLAAVAATLLLTACGGGGSNGGGNVGQGGGEDSFFAAALKIFAESENGDPASLEGLTATTPETSDPARVDNI